MDLLKNIVEWSVAIRRRDGKCLRCGSLRSLVAHHVKPKGEYPELKLEMANGETLCQNCHHEHHLKHPTTNRGQKNLTLRRELKLRKTELAAAQNEIQRLKTENAVLRNELTVKRLEAELGLE